MGSVLSGTGLFLLVDRIIIRIDSPSKRFGSQTTHNWDPMAENPKISTRVRPTIVAYLDDLVKVGAYGDGRADVLRRFLENGIKAALEAGVIPKRDIRDLNETPADEGT